MIRCRLWGGPLNNKLVIVYEGDIIKSHSLEQRDALNRVIVPAQFHEYKKTDSTNVLKETIYEYIGSYNDEVYGEKE